VRFPDLPDGKGLQVGRHGVRFRPQTHELEALAGSSQYGHSFDEWGRYFTQENWNHLRHEVIAARYFSRTPDLPVEGVMQDISDHGRNAKVFAITRRPRFELLTEAGEFTSACAVTVYTGGAFPALGQMSFVAEPAQNLVHRDVLAPAGPTFTARRAHEGVEFLASTDSWFRPVNLTVGPDGALYVVDFYRKVIEHPEWASTSVATSADLYMGQDRGRLYRIVPTATSLPGPGKFDLGRASDAELVIQLQNPNLWWRRTAQRLLVDRGHRDVKPLLEALFDKSRFGLARLHALWTLDGLSALDEATILRALDDPEAGVRENALRLAEPRLTGSPALTAKLLSLASDPDARVRFQVLAALGLVDSPASRAVADRLLREGIEDPWVHLAALLASPGRSSALLASALDPGKGLLAQQSPGRGGFLRLASAAVGAQRRAAAARRIVAAVARPGDATGDWWRTACLEGLTRAAEAQRGDTTALAASADLLLRLFGAGSPPVRHAALRLLQVVGLPQNAVLGPLPERAKALASALAESADSRADAIDFLVLADAAPQAEWLRTLVDPREPEVVQAAAVRGLGKQPGPEAGQFLLSRWRSLTPPVRSEAANALLADPVRARALVAAIKAGGVQAWTLNFDQKREIIMNPDPEIRSLGRPLLEATPADRQAVVARYEAALDRRGDIARGKLVFERACSKCHRLEGTGSEVGPELGTVRNRAPEMLLADILMPNRSIAQKYESYLVETTNGETSTGVMAAETPTTVVLRREGGLESVIPRKEIRKMSVSNLSAMPGDLENQVDPAQMSDLLAYLKGR
jgi:putative heme-binding domain-containing protein